MSKKIPEVIDLFKYKLCLHLVFHFIQNNLSPSDYDQDDTFRI